MKTTKAIAKLMLVTFLPLTQAVAEETAFNNTLDSQQSSVASTEPGIYHFCNNDGEITTSSTELKQWLLTSWDESKVNDAFDMFKQYYSASNMGDGVKALLDTFKRDLLNFPEGGFLTSRSHFLKRFLMEIEGLRGANAIQSVSFLEHFKGRAVTISESKVITFPTGRYDQPQYGVLPQQTPVALVGQFGDNSENHWHPQMRNGETSWVMVWHPEGFSLIKAGKLAVVNGRSAVYADLLENGTVECIEPGVKIYDRFYNDTTETTVPTPVIMKNGVKYMPEIEYHEGDMEWPPFFPTFRPIIWNPFRPFIRNFAEDKTVYFSLKHVLQGAACHFNNDDAGFRDDLACEGDPYVINQLRLKDIQND